MTSYIYLFKFTSFHGSDGSETNHVTSVITKHREDFFPDLNRDLINIVYSCDLGGIGTSEKRRFRRHPTVRLYSQLTQGQEILEPWPCMCSLVMTSPYFYATWNFAIFTQIKESHRFSGKMKLRNYTISFINQNGLHLTLKCLPKLVALFVGAIFCPTVQLLHRDIIPPKWIR